MTLSVVGTRITGMDLSQLVDFSPNSVVTLGVLTVIVKSPGV